MNCSACTPKVCPCPQACAPARPLQFRPDYGLRGPYETRARSRRRRVIRAGLYAAAITFGTCLFFLLALATYLFTP